MKKILSLLGSLPSLSFLQMTDEPVQLRLVSPCIITEEWTGSIFAELEASFAQPSLRYHCVGLFTFSKDFLWEIIQLGQRCQVKGREAESGARPLLRIRTVRKMKVFDLMTGGAEGVQRLRNYDKKNSFFTASLISFCRKNKVVCFFNQIESCVTLVDCVLSCFSGS